MPRISRVRDALMFWSAIGVIVGGIVTTSGPASPSRRVGAEKMHRCHPGCEVYNHSTGAWAQHSATARELAGMGIVDALDLGE